MSDILEKIRRLIALSASSNQNEARNTAFNACRLILEHGIVLTLPVANPAPIATPAPVTTEPDQTALASRQAKGVKVRGKDGKSWTFHDAWGGGGFCKKCKAPCVRGQGVYVLETPFVMLHIPCWRVFLN